MVFIIVLVFLIRPLYKMKLHFVSLLLGGALLATANAQIGSQLSVPNSPAYEQAASHLRDVPPRQYDFSRALLSDVLRLMAEDAGVSFFGLPEGTAGADRLVTFTIQASPFSALETLAKANGVALIYDNDIWYLRPADDTELVGRIYQIAYNAQELVRKNDQGGTSMGGSSNGGGGNSSASSGLQLQGAPDFFVTEPSRLLEDIRSILDMPVTGRFATMAPSASVDTVNQFSVRSLESQPDLVARAPGGEGGDTGGDAGAKVIWNSDSNTLYVVATRQQHQWIEGYLAAADQPQPLVGVEVKFIETNRDPTREFGVDWTGTFGDGYGVNLSGVDSADVGDNGIVNFSGTEDGAINTLIDLNRVGDYKMPWAILSYDQVNVKLRALFEDRNTRMVSYPRMITLDNREVSFRSVINQPVLASSASASLGAGATTTNAVEYIPIGTVINILPKMMSGGEVLLNISITISDIVGTEYINGNPFPIASSRVYTAPVTVESGYTVAISGLDQAAFEKGATGIPVLGRIPIIGNAFKYRRKSESNQHLIMMVTPSLLNPRSPGVSERPSIQNPWKNQPLAESRPASGGVRQVIPVQSMQQAGYAGPPAPEVPQPVFGPHARPERLADHSASEKAGAGPKKSQTVAAPAAKTPVAEIPGWADPLPESAPPVALVTEKPAASPARAAEPSPVASPVAKPVAMVPASPEKSSSPRVVKAPSPAPAVARPAAAPWEIKWNGDELDGGANAVPGAVAYLQEQMKKPESVNSGEVYVQSERLLRYVNQLRDSRSVPVDGELSDQWWNLISLKTRAQNIARENAPAIVESGKTGN